METAEINEGIYKENSYENNLDTTEITLSFSKKDFDKIKAGAYFNNYDSLEEFVIDTVVNEVEAEKQRHLKAKQGNKIKQ